MRAALIRGKRFSKPYIPQNDDVWIQRHPTHCGYNNWPPQIASDGTVFVDLYDDHDCAMGSDPLFHGPLPS